MPAPFAPSAIARLVAAERQRFSDRNPASAALARAAVRHFPGAVPMHWMGDWGTPFPLAVASARGATLTDADGHALADFCLGDTGAMFGHAPGPLVDALGRALADGFTAMLPATETAEVGALLADVFGLPFWQVTQTASDANRAVIRWARGLTGRPRLLVFEGCYHGQVDDAFVARGPDGATIVRPGLVGEVRDLAATAVSVPFNDLSAVEAELDRGDVALVLTEPALTNTAMVLPAPGFLEDLQRACRRTGTLLCLDETHTLSTARGGYGRAHGLEADFLVAGKAVAGGLPAAVFGFTSAIADAMADLDRRRPAGYSGIGTTLSGNRLQMVALRATLGELMTETNYARMLAGAARLAAGLAAVLARHGLPWSVTRLGARAEIVHAPAPLADGAAAARSLDHGLEAAIHLFLLNRDVVVTPFHDMTLVSPVTADADIDRLVAAYDGALSALAA